MIASDLLKLRRRRGLWRTALALPSGLVLLLLVLDLTGVIDADGGARFVTDIGELMSLIVPFLAVLVAARMGSEERAAGTLRYQLLTGCPRSRLYASKVAAFLAAAAAMTLAVVAVITCAGFVLGGLPGDGIALEHVAGAAWTIFLPAVAYGSVAFGVGAIAGSTGPAITVALLLNIVGVNLLWLLTTIDEWFRHLVLSLGIDRLTTDDTEPPDRITFVAAIAVVAGWCAVFLGAGWLKLRRIEA